jgi:hypothetical protein
MRVAWSEGAAAVIVSRQCRFLIYIDWLPKAGAAALVAVGYDLAHVTDITS